MLWFLHQRAQTTGSQHFCASISLFSFPLASLLWRVHLWSLLGLTLTHFVLSKGVYTSSFHLACLLYTLHNCSLTSTQYFIQLLCYNLLIYSRVVGISTISNLLAQIMLNKHFYMLEFLNLSYSPAVTP